MWSHISSLILRFLRQVSSVKWTLIAAFDCWNESGTGWMLCVPHHEKGRSELWLHTLDFWRLSWTKLAVSLCLCVCARTMNAVNHLCGVHKSAGILCVPLLSPVCAMSCDPWLTENDASCENIRISPNTRRSTLALLSCFCTSLGGSRMVLWCFCCCCCIEFYCSLNFSV